MIVCLFNVSISITQCWFTSEKKENLELFTGFFFLFDIAIFDFKTFITNAVFTFYLSLWKAFSLNKNLESKTNNEAPTSQKLAKYGFIVDKLGNLVVNCSQLM